MPAQCLTRVVKGVAVCDDDIPDKSSTRGTAGGYAIQGEPTSIDTSDLQVINVVGTHLPHKYACRGPPCIMSGAAVGVFDTELAALWT